MHIQGRKLKNGEKPQKNVLYEFTDSRVITFKELEVGDVADVEYQLDDNEIGYFAEEYRAATVAKEGAKVVDITAFVIDEQAHICCWWLYDVKKDVGGRDVIQHLCEQWETAYRYLNNSVLSYLIDTPMKITGNIGVITRNFDTGRIQGEFEKLDEKIKKIENDSGESKNLAKGKSIAALRIFYAQRKWLKDMLDKKVCFRCAGNDVELPLNVKISEERNNGEYYYRLVCSHAVC